MLVYLRRLAKRMDKRRFPNDDPLLRSTPKAYDALHELHVNLHYLSCPSGVRRLPAGPDDQGEYENEPTRPYATKHDSERRSGGRHTNTTN
jgi:hypothetical protein